MSETSANIPELSVAAASISDITKTLAGDFKKIKQFLDDREGCWGDDETGKQFGDKYLPQSNDFMEQTAAAMQRLLETAEDVEKIPGQLEEQDADNRMT